jgi:hypothetical protein
MGIQEKHSLLFSGHRIAHAQVEIEIANLRSMLRTLVEQLSFHTFHGHFDSEAENPSQSYPVEDALSSTHAMLLA